MDKKMSIPDYKHSQSGFADHMISFITGLAAGTAVLFIFYKLVLVSIAVGSVIGAVNIFVSMQASIEKRTMKLRTQFFDFLEAISVSMRAGNPLITAMQSAREDLMLLYPEDSDIINELDILIGRFNNAVPISEAFSDLAERSGLEDIADFASIYATIEGKSGKNDEIVRETQQIIGDKMEIDTLLTAAKSEVNIMLCMPLMILGVVGYAGAGFMDAIYTTGVGRVVSTGGFIVFIISYVMARKFSRVKL